MLKAALALCVALSVLATAFVWLMPVEVPQSWALARADDDPYAQFEAIGQAEALWWLARCALPVVNLLLFTAALRLDRVDALAGDIAAGLMRLTSAQGDGNSRPRTSSCWAIRGLLAGWLLLAGMHAVQGVLQRTRDWPYYHLLSGAEVLPNISDSNRDVIRYLREATPPGSRILVFSDQKLFFLSYYLLPRRLLHPIHEESEFVIPLANQARQLAAYQLEDLSAEYVQKLRPDYVLNYFEGERYNNPAKRSSDPQWIRFWQARYQSKELPPYVVELRRSDAGGKP